MLRVQLNASARGHRLVSTEAIAHRSVIFAIRGYQLLANPTYRSVQVDIGAHLEENDTLGYLNHSCNPNVWVHARRLECIALRDIAPGEELTLFYPSTEWDMHRPFACDCGAGSCLGWIAGAKHLPLDTLSRYVINLHIREAALGCLRGDELVPAKGPPLGCSDA